MLVLGIESSGKVGGVALVKRDTVLDEVTADLEMAHAARLAGLIDRVFRNTGLSAGLLEAVGVSAGPGSFTGLRIGMSTAKGLALALGIPLGPVPTLDALSHELREEPGLILSVLDARRGELYCCFYRYREGKPVWKSEYAALSPDEVVNRARSVLAPGEGLTVTGSGVPIVWERLSGELRGGARLRRGSPGCPKPSSVARLAGKNLASGRELDLLEPIYVRRSDAERRKDTRDGG